MSTTASVISFGRRLASLKLFPSSPIRQIGGGKGGKKPSLLWRLVKWTAGGATVTAGVYYGWKYVRKLTRPSFDGREKKKLVILGSGWGALSAINHLEPGQFDVTVVSPRNYFLFSPLLPSVTVGTVESRSIVEPIRKLIRKHHGSNEVTFLEAECVDIEPEKKKIWCEDRSGIVGAVSRVAVDYDLLVVAVGATNNTFKTPGVEQHCHFLKEIDDAQSIRNVIIDLVETASIPGQTEEERKRLLHFVIVGGGPTGVEFAAEVRDFLREDVAKIYPGIEKDTCVTLVQSQDHVLNTYDKQISNYTEERFKMDGINLITNARVTEVSSDSFCVMDKKTRTAEYRPYGICVWSTGISPRPIATTMMKKFGQGERRAIATDKFLRVKGAEGVFAIGDCSTIEQEMMVKKSEELFKEADVNGDGTLTLDEFHKMLDKAKHLYPQVQVQLSYMENNTDKMFQQIDVSGDQKIDYKEFVAMLKLMDRRLKSLPATAQVASQQGSYLGRLLSDTNGEITKQSTAELEKEKVKPFSYRHLGSFAYIGDNKAVLQLPLIGTLSGWWTMWLWRAAYANECASTRTKLLVVGDWGKTFVFGRDSSRI